MPQGICGGAGGGYIEVQVRGRAAWYIVQVRGGDVEVQVRGGTGQRQRLHVWMEVLTWCGL